MKIGIIGGGQLGMMMAEEARKLGHSIVSLDPNPEASITKFSDCHISKDYNDPEVLAYINSICDVITYEFENVDLKVLHKYINKIPQKLKALELSRDRVIEKDYVKSLGVTTPSYNIVNSKQDVFIPSIIKTTSGGYDGKGQFRITKMTDINQLVNIGKTSYICEELIIFDYEISVIATRDYFGGIAFYPIPRNKHVGGILHTSIVEGTIPTHISSRAEAYTKRILEDLDYVGTLAVEYFVRKEEVIFNEFAPRPHNSGHYTMDGCNVSQFKNHILAISNQKVIEPVLLSNTVMINVLGQNKSYYDNSNKFSSAKIHDYHKHSTRVNRKIGHINITYKDKLELKQIMKHIIKE